MKKAIDVTLRIIQGLFLLLAGVSLFYAIVYGIDAAPPLFILYITIAMLVCVAIVLLLEGVVSIKEKKSIAKPIKSLSHRFKVGDKILNSVDEAWEVVELMESPHTYLLKPINGNLAEGYSGSNGLYSFSENPGWRLL